MSNAPSSPTRRCPSCSAPNSSYSLFCAECGTALNDEPTGATAALPSASDSSTQSTQSTQAFTPVPASWRSDPQTAVDASTRQWSPSAAPPSWPANGTTEIAAFDEPESMRGFFLGLVALLLIALVIGLFVWTSVISDDSRDTVTGWFDFIG